MTNMDQFLAAKCIVAGYPHIFRGRGGPSSSNKRPCALQLYINRCCLSLSVSYKSWNLYIVY